MKYQNYILGSFVSGAGDEFVIKNVYDDSEFAEVHFLSDEEVENLIKKAHQNKLSARSISNIQKQEDLLFISKEILLRKAELATTIAAESGKPLKYALAEVERASQTFEFAAKELEKASFEKTQIGIGTQKKMAQIHRFPVGLVLGISPFNFPLNLVAHKIAPAIATGCVIILKPSPRTPITALKLAEIISQTKVVKYNVAIVNMTLEQTALLLKDERVAKISFTGSDKVGWDIQAQSSKKKITLELGGNAATIISDTANIEQAIPQCLIGAFAYSGQVCIHSQRFYVHEKWYEFFIEKMVEGAKSLTIGNPLDINTEFSVLINEAAAIRIESWVNEAIAQGAKLITGGYRSGKMYDPTILTNTHPKMKIVSEEVFGPVICIEKFLQIEEAIHEVNLGKFGLQTSIFTQNHQEVQKAFEQIESGSILVNLPTTFRTDDMPYGGVKDSGFGREGVKYAMEEMTEIKLLVL
jgi:glyceraldehyde-3-phosphate dehydrogenase (NADP+)